MAEINILCDILEIEEIPEPYKVACDLTVLANSIHWLDVEESKRKLTKEEEEIREDYENDFDEICDQFNLTRRRGYDPKGFAMYIYFPHTGIDLVNPEEGLGIGNTEDLTHVDEEQLVEDIVDLLQDDFYWE